MKKGFLLFTATLLFQVTGFAQFYFSHVFPVEVLGDPSGDTLINTRALILKEGIRKIYSWQNQPEATKTYFSKTMNFNKNGNIEAITYCFAKNKSLDTTFCLTDTFLYDGKGRNIEMKMIDNKGNEDSQYITDYIGEKEIKRFSITRLNSDTLTDYEYFNEKGQMVGLKQIRKGQTPSYCSFYYNTDGLLDSCRYENSSWGTSVFKRSKKGRKKVIEMETPEATLKWTYNLSGQCLTYNYTRKDGLGRLYPENKGQFSSTVSYFYNENGTLSKVIQERTNLPKTTIYYSYSK